MGVAASAEPRADLALEAEGSVLARKTVFGTEHKHGQWMLDEIQGASTRVLALLARDPTLASIDLGRALFLDTETSGLSGGAGTWVFLVGLGAFERTVSGEGRFLVWQGFLADPACERALLLHVADRIRAASTVVSFFGKAFDRHRLEDKMRLHGIDLPFAGRPHLDLYHPLRRLYRPRGGGGLADGRLRTFERELCGVEREDDLPGSRAPAAWFDFLRGRPHELEGVFRHNRDDVLSLVVLAAHLSRTLEETREGGAALTGPAAARAGGVARVLVEAREHRESLAWFERAIERGGGSLPEAWARLFERARRRVRAAAAS
jgi:uncharacterized protein YprB with RNaseH-like and TPR domain